MLHILVFYAEDFCVACWASARDQDRPRLKAEPCDEGRRGVGMAQISIVGQPLEDPPRIPSRRSFPKNLRAIVDIRCEVVLTD